MFAAIYRLRLAIQALADENASASQAQTVIGNPGDLAVNIGAINAPAEA
ncbi:MAG: hypothetical protein NZ553_10130 [Caldilinea sp.]|nr:hypothetical protein [Caldilinea sp.]MDW8440820.1 hypothetical protein [Caldilineaceae bacterium]